jgi:hypothetical protein
MKPGDLVKFTTFFDLFDVDGSACRVSSIRPGDVGLVTELNTRTSKGRLRYRPILGVLIGGRVCHVREDDLELVREQEVVVQ